MASLSAHLRQPENHARLTFRSDCPWCAAERLAGELPSDRLISPRVPATIAAGVLALSSTAPGLAIGAEPDQRREGNAAPQDPIPPDSAQRPEFEPGGTPTTLPDEPSDLPSPATPEGNLDSTSTDQEPAVDTPEPVVDPGDGPSEPDAPASVDGQSVPAALPGEPEPTQPPASAPAAAVPDPAPEPTAAGPPPLLVKVAPERAPKIVRDLPRGRLRERVRRVIAQGRSGEPESRGQGVQRVVEGAGDLVARSPVRSQHGEVARGARWYVVQSGDSLWGIAARLLGHHADAQGSDVQAAIGAEVDRLWRLNGERIATGDPSLILPGQRLRLR